MQRYKLPNWPFRYLLLMIQQIVYAPILFLSVHLYGSLLQPKFQLLVYLNPIFFLYPAYNLPEDPSSRSPGCGAYLTDQTDKPLTIPAAPDIDTRFPVERL